MAYTDVVVFRNAETEHSHQPGPDEYLVLMEQQQVVSAVDCITVD